MTCRFCLCFDGSQQGDADDDVDECDDGEDIMMTCLLYTSDAADE